jgi:hypothetical protein
VKDRIGQDETKILDYVPPKLQVHVHVRPKYACRYCKDGVVTRPVLPQVKQLCGVWGQRAMMRSEALLAGRTSVLLGQRGVDTRPAKASRPSDGRYLTSL